MKGRDHKPSVHNSDHRYLSSPCTCYLPAYLISPTVLLLIQPLQPPTSSQAHQISCDSLRMPCIPLRFCSLFSPVHFEEGSAHNRCSMNICLQKERMNEALYDYITDVAKDYK